MNPPISGLPPLVLANKLSRNGARSRSPISLTPLIDVVFILLIFFMLASSLLDWRTIELNTPNKAAASTAAEGALLVDVRRDGLRLSNENITLEELALRIAQRVKEKPDQRIVIKPAPGVVFQDAITVLDRLSSVGVKALSLTRDPEAQ